MVREIRITDPAVLSLVDREKASTGEKTATRTAARLIIERLASREQKAAAYGVEIEQINAACQPAADLQPAA